MSRLCGSYESLRGGTIGEALEDLTGGITEYIDLGELNEFEVKNPRQLFDILLRSHLRSSLMGCSIRVFHSIFTDARTHSFTLSPSPLLSFPLLCS